MLRLLAIRLVGTGWCGLADVVATLTADCGLVLIALLLSAVAPVVALIVLEPIPAASAALAGIVMVAVGVPPTELVGDPPQSGSDREPGSTVAIVVAATGDELAEAEGTAGVGVDGAGIGVTVMKLR